MNTRFITHVRRDTSDRITHLRVVTPNGIAQERARAGVVQDIDWGTRHRTRYTRNGRMVDGAFVEVITVNGRKWLRTDANRVASDNLENLPSF